MTIEEAAARLRKRRMLREQPPIPETPVGATPIPIAPRTRFAIHRIAVDMASGEERRRTLVDTKQRFESAQGAALARNISEESDDIFVVVREEV